MSQKGNFFRPYVKDPNTGKSIYIHKGPNDLGKGDIPIEDRCDPEEFNRIWNLVFKQVMQYWEFVPVKDIHEFDRYDDVDEETGAI